MKNLIVLIMILFSLLVTSCYSDSDDNSNNLILYDAYENGIRGKNQIVFEGDSNTDNIKIGRYFHISEAYNLSAPGSGVQSCLNRIDEMESLSPAIIIVMVGTSEVNLINNGHETELNFYVKYNELLSKYKSITNTVYAVSIMSSTSSIYTAHYPWTEELCPNIEIRRMNNELKIIAQNNNVVFIDLWDYFYDSTNDRIKESFDSDGLHYNQYGIDNHVQKIKEKIYE